MMTMTAHRIFKLRRGIFSSVNIFISVHRANFVLLRVVDVDAVGDKVSANS